MSGPTPTGTRALRKRAEGKKAAAEQHEANRLCNNLSRARKRAKRLTKPDRQRLPLIQGMTNWQRKKWAQAGYPKDVKKIREFANMQRPG